MSEVWHKVRRRNRRDDFIETWCGKQWSIGAVRKIPFLGRKPYCPDCRAARQAAKERA